MPSPPDPEPSAALVLPEARRLAQQLGLDIARIAGTGPQGQVIEADVLAFARAQLSQASPEEKPAPPALPYSAVSPPRPAPPARPVSSPTRDWSSQEQAERALTLANIQFRRGQTAEAEKSLGEVLQARPRDAAAQELMADIRLARGDFDGAQQSLKAALEIQPGRPTAEAKLARMVLRRTEQDRLKNIGVAYAASDTAFVRIGGGRRGGQWGALASALLPGLGQFLNGEAVKGSVLLALTGLGLLVLALVPGAGDGLTQLALSAAGGHHRHAEASASGLGWFVLLLLTVVWIYSIVDAVLASRRAAAPSSRHDRDGWQV